MCGYVRRHIGPKSLEEFLAIIGLPQLKFHFPEDGNPQHFYPAFGGVPEKRIKDLIIQEDGQLKTVDATWWYECEEQGDSLKVNNRKTTLNARNLHLEYWQDAIRYRRGIVVGTALGEAIERDGKKSQFFVEGKQPLLLGCVYQKFSNDLYSCAVITRNAHPRFKNYHDDAFPLMLPPDPKFLKLWLSPDQGETHSAITSLLDQPKIFTDLIVTPVKTYKDAKPVGGPNQIAADE